MPPSTPSPSHHRRNPGIMLVHPRLHTPSPTDSATFLRWTKLHFRDMLNMPDDPELGRMTRSLRFVARNSKGDADGDGNAYLYTLIVDDVGVFQSQVYYDVDRRLNLEKGRVLGEGEEGVGYAEREGNGGGREAMVFDIVDARFAILEEVESGSVGDKPGAARAIDSYQNLPLSHTSKAGSTPSAPHSVLISVSVKVSSSTPPASDIPQTLQTSLVEHFAAAPAGLRLYTSLYRWAGVEAQPKDHPMIDMEASGEWLITLLIVDEEGGLLKRGHVVELVDKWADGVGKEEGSTVNIGVWDGEVFMS